MANAFYTVHDNRLLKGDIDYDTMVVLVDLVDAADYTFSAGHGSRSNVNTGGAVVATSAELTPSVSGGTVDLPNFTFTAVSGDVSEALVFYVRTAGAADAATYPICYIDTPTSGLAVTPNGQDINVTVTNLFTL